MRHRSAGFVGTLLTLVLALLLLAQTAPCGETAMVPSSASYTAQAAETDRLHTDERGDDDQVRRGRIPSGTGTMSQLKQRPTPTAPTGNSPDAARVGTGAGQPDWRMPASARGSSHQLSTVFQVFRH
ncbi:hypothetical protein [Streptomyces syringium]|uniref:Secreted protein n=1 Tax=Streptomyces syringium TaxID=76729 RepID=A0ABS4Y8N4_9ACTN|nr:hypothetical protein [Streptomyces syringium]MBP2404787.1 hypothetical protein [Streptomyces syringium]SPE57750.1 hypothetical protein SNS2_3404 [Streptomyces netropsis]